MIGRYLVVSNPSDCLGFWFGETRRYGLDVVSTCSRSHLRAIQPHQCSHDAVVVATAACPHHHLLVATFSEFRVSQCRVTLDHCWQWRPQCIFQLLKTEFPPRHVRYERGLCFDVPLSLEEGVLDLRRFVLVLRDLPTSVQFFHDQINAVILYQSIVHDDLCCSPALAFQLSQKPSPLPVLLPR